MFDYVATSASPNPPLVLNTTDDGRKLVKYIPYATAVLFALPATTEDLRRLHRAKYWSTLRRKERRFVEAHGPLRFRVITDERELQAVLPLVQQLYRQRWRDEYTSLPWKTEEGFAPYREAMLDLASRGEAELAVLESETDLLSFAYCIIQGGTYYFYQHATRTEGKYGEYSVGKLLVWKLITHLVERAEFHTLDFMLGEDDYKREWSTSSRTVYLRIAEDANLRGLVRYFVKRVYYPAKLYVQFRNPTLRRLAKRLLFVLQSQRDRGA